ncbi:hypothetical protein BGX29_000683 [Mortierella sp. GBA35]|nr:hypothetical protein BGX29_000683 [Mortierella sp. GBA35]
MASPITPLCLPTRIDGSGLPSPNGSSSAAAATEPGGAGPSLSSFLVMNSRVLHLILDKISSLETGVGRLEQSFYKHFSSPPCQGEGVETEPRRDSEDDDKAAWAESLRVQIQNAFDHFKDQVGQVLTDQTQLIEDLNTWTGAADARHAQDIKEISDAVDERVQMALDTFYEQAREDVSEQRRILQDLSAWTTAFDARHARQGDEIKDTVAKQIHASVHDIQEQVRQELSAWSSALDARHAQEIGETQTAFNATQAQNRQEMSAWTTAFDARHAQQTRTLNLIAQQNADILMEQNRVLKSSTLQRPGDGPSERHAFMDASPPVVVIRDAGYHSPSEGDQFGLYTDSGDELHRSTSSIPTAQRRDSPIAEQTTSPSEASKGKRVLRREHAPPAMTSSPGADYQIRLNFGTEGLVSMAADVLTTSSTPGSSNPKEPYVIIDDEDDAVVIIGGLHNLVTRETMRKRGAETSTTLATTSKRRLRLRNAGTVGSPSSPTLTTAVVNRPKVDLVSLQDKPMSVKMEGVMDYSQRLTRSVRKTAQPDVIHLDLDSVKERAREAGIPWWKRI